MALIPSLNPYGSNTIATGEIVQAPHVYQFVRAFAGLEAYNIFLSGSFNVTGSTSLSGSLNIIGLTVSNPSSVLGVDSSGNVFFMNTSSIFPSNGLTGNGLDHYLAMWSGSSYITSSIVYQNSLGNIGIGTTNPTNLFTVSGSVGFTGSFGLNGLQNTTSSYVLGIDPITGNVTTTQVSSLSSSFATPAGNDWDIQLKSGSRFAVATLGSGSYNYNYGAWTFGVRGSGTIGSWSFSEGSGSLASGDNSHTEGILNTASNIASHAEGSYNISSGQNSHAEGSNVIASGDNSHAQGYNTTAIGLNSNSEGIGTISSGSNQSVVGAYNLQNNITDIFIIGSGSGNLTRFDLATFGNNIKFNKLTQVTGNFYVTGSSFLSSSLTVTGITTLSGSTNISGSLNIIGPSTSIQPQILSIDSNGNVFFMNTSSIYTAPSGSSGITGSGVNNYVVVWSGSQFLVTGSILYNDHSTQRLGVGTINPTNTLTISGSEAITGSWNLTGSANIIGPTLIPQSRILAIDPLGNVTLMDTSSIYPYSSSSLGGPAGKDWDIQLRSGSQFAVATTGTGSYNYDYGAWMFGTRGLVSSSFPIGSWSFAANNNNVTIGKYSFAKGYNNIAGDDADSVEGFNTATVNNTLANLNLNFNYTSSKLIATQPGNYVSSLTSLGFLNSNLNKWYYNNFDSTLYEASISSITYNSGTTFTEISLGNLVGTDDISGNGIIYFQLYNSDLKGNPLANHSEGEGSIAAGDASHAEGKYSIALNEGSHAEGFNTISSGTGSHSEGRNSIASGNEAHAEGSNTLSSGTSAHSEGYSTTASGDFSHAEGYYTIAKTNYTHAEGRENIAYQTGSHAEGYKTISSGSYSHTEGYQTITSNSYSHAEGYGTLALGHASHAEGNSNILSYLDSGSHIEGNANVGGLKLISGSFNDYVYNSLYFYYPAVRGLFFVGDISSNFSIGQTIFWYHSDLNRFFKSTISNINYDVVGETEITIFEDPTNNTPDNNNNPILSPGIYIFTSSLFNHIEGAGNLVFDSIYSHIEGLNNSLYGSYNHAEGASNNIRGIYNHVEGVSHIIDGTSNHIEGGANYTFIDTYYSHLEGTNNYIYGLYNHAEGSYNTISGSYNHIGGNGNIITGSYNYNIGFIININGDKNFGSGENNNITGHSNNIEGYLNYIIGNYNHAEGYRNLITNNISGSHVEGRLTTASEDYSHAEGLESQANARYSHAEGYRSQTTADYSHAEGFDTIAAGDASHAEGHSTMALGSYSHAEGSGSVAYSNSSHAGGIGTISSGSGQTVVGTYNLKNNTTSLFTVGNGTSDSNRSDILNITSNSVSITGSFYINNQLIQGVSTYFKSINTPLQGYSSGILGGYNGISASLHFSPVLSAGDKIVMEAVLDVIGGTSNTLTVSFYPDDILSVGLSVPFQASMALNSADSPLIRVYSETIISSSQASPGKQAFRNYTRYEFNKFCNTGGLTTSVGFSENFYEDNSTGMSTSSLLDPTIFFGEGGAGTETALRIKEFNCTIYKKTQ